MKKVLSFVLVLALVLSSFSMAFAGETVTNYTQLTDIDGIANEEAVEVCNNLGIVTGNPDGTFQPEKAVNRAEFAAMITRALGIPESALAGYATTSFKDTNGYGWAVPYLAFCESKGIMLGDGAGNAMPGRTINTNEAVTMILRAIGYTANSAELVGTWPSNYVTKAQDLGIYDDVAAVSSVDKANAAQMIYNALTVDKVAVNSDGKTEYVKAADGKVANMLTAGLNCSLDTAGADDNGRKVVVYTDDAVMNIMPHVGEYAKVYLNKDDDVIAIADVDSEVITGTFKTNEDASASLNGVTFYGDDDVTYTITDKTTDRAFFLNNDVAVAGDLNVYGGNMLCDDDDAATYTLNVKTSGKTITAIYSIERFAADAASQITADEISDITSSQKLLGYDFDTDKKDNIIENSFELIGAKSLSDIKKDDIVYVYHDGSSDKLITRVEVGTNVVEGTVSKTNDSGSKVTVNGETYKYASLNVAGQSGLAGDLEGAKTAGKIEAGDTVKLYLDAQGYIYDYDLTEGSADDYAVVINVGETTSSTMDSDVQIKMMTADGNVKTYIFDIDDFEVTSFAAMNITAGSIIKYSLNKDGEVDDIESGTKVLDNNGVVQNNTDWSVASNLTGTADVNKEGYYAGLEINSDAVLFTADVTNFDNLGTTADSELTDKDNYDVTTFEKLKDTDDVKAFYVVDEDGNIECMLLDANATSDKDIYGVVTDKYISTDADGDKTYMITALVDGKTVDYEAKNQSVWSGYNYTSFYEFKLNSSNQLDGTGAVIDNVGTIVQALGSKAYATTIGGLTSASSISVNGKVVKIDVEGDQNVDHTITVASNTVVYVYDTEDDEFQVKTLNSAKNDISKNAGANTRTMLFFITDTDDSSAPNIVVVFDEQ
ncbi:MAG: S-layer homology domain-containing protein [Anaerovoracaceae bacterium]